MTWPVSAPTFGSYNWFAMSLGIHLDLGADFNAWTAAQAAEVDWCLNMGLKRFYFPPPVGQEGKSHQWSFLSPTATIALGSGTQAYDLPADFAGNVECFTYASATGHRKVPIVSESELRAAVAVEGASNATPKFAAIRPKTADGTAVQRYEAVFYPTPNATLTVTYRYQANPLLATTTALYPLGATAHVDTILQAMVATAELRKKKAKGEQWSTFLEMLAQSIETDKAVAKTTGPSLWATTEPAYGTFGYFLREIGAHLGYGSLPDTYSYAQEREVNAIVQSGLRQFYNPPLPAGAKKHVEWSFLKPTATLSLVNGTAAYDLPATFGTIFDDATYASGVVQKRLEIVNETTIRALQATAAASGAPKYIAIHPKAVALTAVQAWEAIVYPTPDTSYTVTYRYNYSPADASSTNLYPLGTNVHAETILASCFSIAELRKTGQIGPHHQRFLERLQASIGIDERSSRSSDIARPVPEMARNDMAVAK